MRKPKGFCEGERVDSEVVVFIRKMVAMAPIYRKRLGFFFFFFDMEKETWL